MMFRLVLLFCLVTILCGCDTLFGSNGYFRDKQDDYLKTDTIRPMDIPDTVDETRFQDLYVIPHVEDTGDVVASEFKVPPPPDVVEDEAGMVKIQRLGDRQWIVVNRPPSQVWPKVRAFLNDQRWDPEVSDPANGIFETAWLLAKDDEDSKDRFRIRLSQGLKLRTTEVHITQLTVPRNTPATGNIDWPSRSSNITRETWLVNNLSKALLDDSAGTYSMMAQTIGSNIPVRLIRVDRQTDPLLLVNIDYERAWASIGMALEGGGFSVQNTLRDQGMYQIDFGQEQDDATETTPYRVLVLLKGGQVVVRVRDEQGNPLPVERAEYLLRLIRSRLV